MSFVLSVVCVRPRADPSLPDGSLLIEEVVQDAGASHRACYIPGLSKFFDSPVEGRGYYVWIENGERYPSSQNFFKALATSHAEEQPIAVQIDLEYRVAFATLLQVLLEISSVQRVLIVAEWNGDVTAAGVSRQQALAELAAGDVFLYGPLSSSEFWLQHDNCEILYPSVTIIQEDTRLDRCTQEMS
jgi:hypothetical protein